MKRLIFIALLAVSVLSTASAGVAPTCFPCSGAAEVAPTCFPCDNV